MKKNDSLYLENEPSSIFSYFIENRAAELRSFVFLKTKIGKNL